MKIRYLPKTGIAPLVMASEEMEVIRIVKPGEQYPLGGAGMINRSDKLIYVCKEGPVHEVAVDEDHVRILPPEFKSRREAVIKEALGYINDYRGSKVVTPPPPARPPWISTAIGQSFTVPTGCRSCA